MHGGGPRLGDGQRGGGLGLAQRQNPTFVVLLFTLYIFAVL
jgi:hypothetical protein